jgi:hypothetical protein
MKRESCRTCGRWGVNDDRPCRQFQMPSGEYECPGDGPHDVDDDGFFLYRTPEEEAEQEAHWEAVIQDARARGEI